MFHKMGHMFQAAQILEKVRVTNFENEISGIVKV